MALAELTNHPYWHFSIGAWQQEYVEEKCLVLQNKYNLNRGLIQQITILAGMSLTI
jgi:hypothetical protein